jgi:succinyl-CoA synthetase alpha subunit
VAIFLDKNSKVIVQGITGREGLFHTGKMLAYGTNIVGGVTPGKGGTTIESGQPVFNTVKDAVDSTGATHSIILVPPFAGADALYEAFDDARHAHHRAELSRPHLARQIAHGYHAEPGVQRR